MEYRKAFRDIKSCGYIYDPDTKNHRHIFKSELEEVRKNLNKLKKILKSKKFQGNIDSVDFKDLDDNNYDFADDDEYRKTGAIITLLKEFDTDYSNQKELMMVLLEII